MNIVIRELKTNLKSLAIWCAAMVFLIYAGMVKYSAFVKTGETINDFMKNLPAGMASVLGIGNGADLTSVAVFYSIFFLYFMLLAAVHSGMLGALIIAKEERDKTADFLFVKPIKRRQVISRKLAAALLNILAFNLVTFLVSAVSVEQYNTGDSLVLSVFWVTSALFVLQLLFLGLGLLFGALAKSAKTAASAVSFVILGAFILKVVIELNDKFEPLTFLSPFMYFSANGLMFDHRIDLGYSTLALALTVACAAGSYWFFSKRDLHS